MSRILYGVCGEGFGHSSRSETVSSLLKGHEIVFAASKNAYEHLTGLGKTVIKIQGLGFALKDRQVDVLQTVWKNLAEADAIGSVGKILDYCSTWKPDLVITDFEPYTAIAAKILQKPLVSIDHEKIIDKTKIEFPKERQADYLGAQVVTGNMVNFADRYIITSFFYPEVKDKNAIIIPPLIRQEILKAKPKRRDYTLVYQSYAGNSALESTLEEIRRERFIIYGKMKGRRRNLTFKVQSKVGFIRDLAGAKAVITNGGYTLISEALHLGKPVLSMPVPGQFEQALNAFYLDRLGYGKYYDELDDVKVIGFLHNLEKYHGNIVNVRRDGNQVLLSIIGPYLRNSHLKISAARSCRRISGTGMGLAEPQ